MQSFTLMSLLIPIPRKQTYQTFFNVNSESETQGVYQWHQDLAAEAFLILCDFEVIFRSKIHQAMAYLNCYPNQDDWIVSSRQQQNLVNKLQRDMLSAQQAGKDFYPDARNYNLHSSFQLSGKDRQNFINLICEYIKKGKNSFTHDDLVASVSFGFWVSLLKRLEGLKHGSLITQYLTEIFPHSTKGFDLNLLKSILDTLNRIKSFRNRIGHHDSIMRIPEPIAGHPDFYPRTVNQMINSLKILLLSLLDLVRDIDPQCSLAIEQSKNWKSFFLLLKVDSFQIYRSNSGNLESYVICYLNNSYNTFDK